MPTTRSASNGKKASSSKFVVTLGESGEEEPSSRLSDVGEVNDDLQVSKARFQRDRGVRTLSRAIFQLCSVESMISRRLRRTYFGKIGDLSKR